MTADKRAALWLLAVITVYSTDTVRGAGRRLMPDIEPQLQAVTLFCCKMRSRRAASNKVEIVTFMIPTAV
eukprot:6744290-Prymnesium_polylepis.1